MTSSLLLICVAAMHPMVMRLFWPIDKVVIDSHLLRWAKQYFRHDIIKELFAGKGRGDGLMINKPMSLETPQFSPQTIATWGRYVSTAIELKNPHGMMYAAEVVFTFEDRYEEESRVFVRVEDTSASCVAETIAGLRAEAAANLRTGAQRVIDAMQASLDSEAETMYWIVCTSAAKYHTFCSTFKGLQKAESIYYTANRGPFGMKMPTPMDAEKVKQQHLRTMAKFHMRLEREMENLCDDKAAGLTPDPKRMLALMLMVEFVDGKLTIDLRDAAVMNRRFHSLFNYILYCDGFPSANTDMCDTAWWVVDMARAIWKGALSKLVLDSLWSVLGEKLFFSLFEGRSVAPFDGAGWVRLDFPFAALTDGAWPDTWLELRLTPAPIWIAGDNKFLCLVAGCVGGSGLNRGHWGCP